MIVAVKPQPLSTLALTPINENDRRMISQSNEYDGSCIAYLIDSQDIDNFLSTLSFEQQGEINNGYTVQIEIDAWEFRHMVGGQNN